MQLCTDYSTNVQTIPQTEKTERRTNRKTRTDRYRKAQSNKTAKGQKNKWGEGRTQNWQTRVANKEKIPETEEHTHTHTQKEEVYHENVLILTLF